MDVTTAEYDNATNYTYFVYDGNCTIVTPENILANGYFRTVVYSIYGFIFVVALLGNSSVCYIVLASPRMRTVTNYFITNLAVGDLLITLLCVPFTCVALLQQYWSFGRFLCPLVAYSQALSVFVSAYTLVAISIDKYMVIMWPLKPRISKGCATSIIAVVWLIAAVTVLPIGLFTRLIQPQAVYESCDKYICTEDWSDWPGVEYGAMYTKILMVLQYVIPAIVLIFTYTSIAAVMWCHRIPGEAENSRDKRIARSKRKMIKMMVVVVFVYTVCWLPFNVLMIVNESVPQTIMVFLYFSMYGLAMSHAIYNPVIYCYMNSRFRDGFRVMLRLLPCFRRCCKRPGSRRSCSSGYPHGGIGFEAAVEFAKRGAKVILACRDEEKAKVAKDKIVKLTTNQAVSFKCVDMVSFESVRKFAEEILESEDRLDILVNNAGAGGLRNKTTDDGLEITVQINYFSPFLLTYLLIDLLKKSAPSRIINTSSILAGNAELDVNDLNKFFGTYTIYSNSKLCNILFTKELAKKLEGTGVTAFSLHPGAVETDIFRRIRGFWRKAVYRIIVSMYFKTPEEGAQTTIYTATQQGIERLSGGHFEECGIVSDYNAARDSKLSKKLWEKTVEILKLKEKAT